MQRRLEVQVAHATLGWSSIGATSLRRGRSRLILLVALGGTLACYGNTGPGPDADADADAWPPSGSCEAIEGGCRCDPGVEEPGACGPDTGVGELVCCLASSGECDCLRRAYTGTWECRRYTAGTMAYCNCGEGAPGGGTPTDTCTSEGTGPCWASLRGGFCECQPGSVGVGTVAVASCTPRPREVGSYDCPDGASRVYACDGAEAPSCGQPGDSCTGDVDCCIPLCCGDILGCC
jgi:hypothetical protein